MLHQLHAQMIMHICERMVYLIWDINRMLQLGGPAAGVLQKLGGSHARGITGLMLQPRTGHAAMQAECLQQHCRDNA